MKYENNEIRAVKYYIGDVRNVPEDGFWNDPKAYCLLNALFFPGIAAESARTAEGKRLNLEILADIPRLTSFFEALFSVFRKSPAKNHYSTFRVERFSDYEFMRKSGKTVSFTSTSEAGFLKAYQDRRGIALLKFEIPEQTPCIRMQEFFQEYAKPEEAEILLPPGLNLHFENLPLSEQEQQILDADGNPPLISCSVSIEGISRDIPDSSPILPEGGNLAGIRVIQALQSGRTPDADEISGYSVWKKAFSEKVLHDFLKNSQNENF